jgi:hypothetical protein
MLSTQLTMRNRFGFGISMLSVSTRHAYMQGRPFLPFTLAVMNRMFEPGRKPPELGFRLCQRSVLEAPESQKILERAGRMCQRVKSAVSHECPQSDEILVDNAANMQGLTGGTHHCWVPGG